MSKEKNARFTIGQFAALHGINKKTLMWYDEIGLFRPAEVNRENGYRYYSYYQSTVLETILMLRDMNVSLDNIRRFMENRSAESMEALLREKIRELDETISNLRAVRSKLRGRHEDMADLLELDVAGIRIVEREPVYLAEVCTTPETPLEEEIEMVISKVKQFRLPRLYSASYGSMIPVESLYAGRFDDYSRLFVEVPGETGQKGLRRRPGGTYLQAYCLGSWDRLPGRYEEILAYAAEQGLRLTGFSYEIGVNEMVIDSMEDYITRIEILAEKNL